MKEKSTTKKEYLKIQLCKDNPYQSIHNRLKRLKNYEKELLIDLYFAVQDAIQYRNDNIEMISEMDEFTIDKKNEEINDELNIIKSYEIYESILELVIGGKYFEKIGLWEKIKDK